MGDRQTNGGQTGICFGSGMSFGVEADEKTRVGLSRKSFGSEIGLVIEFGVRFIRDERSKKEIHQEDGRKGKKRAKKERLRSEIVLGQDWGSCENEIILVFLGRNLGQGYDAG